VTGYVVASAEPSGAALRVVTAADGDEAQLRDASRGGICAQFDLVDWGNGVRALRAAANSRHVTVDDDGMLVNDQLRPGGWVVRETFRLVSRGDGETVIHHIASGRYVTIDADGALCARGDSLDDATGFALELVSSGRAAAVTAARDADVAIVVLGNHPLINGRETEDRVDLALPRSQDELLRDVHAANPATVLFVQSSYPYAIGWAQQQVPAILWSAHGGQEFGHALADVLFGEAAPAGRLTQTWYTSSADLPDLLDYDIIETDATYLYYCDAPLYPFGHGLTYTTFEYDDLVCTPASVEPDAEITVSVRITNTGPRASDEVVQLYTRQHTSRVKQPRRRLRGFRRIHLASGAQTTVTFQLHAADLAFWDVTRGRSVVEQARHSVMVGRSSADVRQATTVTVLGETIPPRSAALIAAIAYDDYCDISLRDTSRVGGDAVESIRAASWIGYCDVDFGPTGASTCVARVRADDDAPLTLRRGDPLTGEVIGELTVPAGDRYGWVDVTLAVNAPAGVHDLYVAFGAAGTSIESLAFGRP
jgi:beta-glucosidase